VDKNQNKKGTLVCTVNGKHSFMNSIKGHTTHFISR
jgi:hypothetical protein